MNGLFVRLEGCSASVIWSALLAKLHTLTRPAFSVHTRTMQVLSALLAPLPQLISSRIPQPLILIGSSCCVVECTGKFKRLDSLMQGLKRLQYVHARRGLTYKCMLLGCTSMGPQSVPKLYICSLAVCKETVIAIIPQCAQQACWSASAPQSDTQL